MAAGLAVVVLVAGAVWLIRQLAPAGERFGSVPEGWLSSLVWQDGSLYVARMPMYASYGHVELWKISASGETVQVPFGGECAGEISALAVQRPGHLLLARECESPGDGRYEDDRYEREIAVLDLGTGRLEVVAHLPPDDGGPPVVDRMLWAGDTIVISGDGYQCGGIALVRDGALVPIPPLHLDGKALELSASYQRRSGDCVDLPPSGFVTRVGSSLAFLAAPKAVGVAPDDRGDVEWSGYVTTDAWRSCRQVIPTLSHPTQLVGTDSGLLVSADLEGPGIWHVPLDGGPASLVVDAAVSDFAVDETSGAIAILGPNGREDSLRIVRNPAMPTG